MSLLPDTYAALEPFAARWALPTTAERAAARSHSTPEERQALYDAVAPVAARALEDLDAKPLDALNERERRLLDLLMAFSHASLAVEVQGPDEAQHRLWRDRMVITRSPADATRAA